MSIKQVQIANILEIIAKVHLMDGQSPLLDDIYRYVNRFFSDQKPGTPYTMSVETIRTMALADTEVMNDLMAIIIANADTLFETCFNHVDQQMVLQTLFRNDLERLRIKRARLNSKIEDYLLGIYNSDGYFYSYSDDFSSTANVDFTRTDAYIDTAAGVVTIPAVSTKSKLIDPAAVSITGAVKATTKLGTTVELKQKSAFSDALDGLTNTAWQIEVKTNDPGPITLEFLLGFSDSITDNFVTKIDVIPFGIEPVKVGIEAQYVNTTEMAPFSAHIKTSADKMVFVSDQPRAGLRRLRFQVTKPKHDYEINDSREKTLVYLFGFREIMISEQHFDLSASFISTPISLPSDLGDEAIIDAISLQTDDDRAAGTNITYYVAADYSDDETIINEFDWKRIEPLTDSALLSSQIVRFDGTQKSSRMIRLNPRHDGEKKLFDLNNTSADPASRNPTYSYFSTPTYRLTEFRDDYLANTLNLEEGINSTKIYYTALSTEAYTRGFDFWKTKFDTPNSYVTVYGEIDSGHGFLYGADVGENGKSVFSETFLYVDEELPVMLKECRKVDSNAKTWDVKVYLNGREIAALPAGVDRLTVPWKFQQGKNHIVVMANIPSVSVGTSAPYIGTFDIMSGDSLEDYGLVKLDDWVYVDPYKFENNLTNSSLAFTIYNEEIVTRRQPTDNFRLTYNQAKPTAPPAIRLRAELQRSKSMANVTPVIDSYRVRFAYSR